MKKPPAKRPAHRPTAWTAELQAAFCEHIRAARTVEEACKAVSISTTTYWNWCDAGRAGQSPYVGFLAAVEKAKRDRVQALADMVTKAGRKDWRAADRMLQVLAPKEYAPRIRVHLEEEFSRAISRVQAAFAGEPDVLDRVLAALAGELGESGPAAAAGGEADGSGASGDGGGEAVRPAPTE